MLGFGKRTHIKKMDSNSVENSKRRLLTVEVVEARGLKALSKSKSSFSSSAPTSDPFGQIGFVDMVNRRDIKNETFKLPQKTGTTAPKWNQTVIFGTLQ